MRVSEIHVKRIRVNQGLGEAKILLSNLYTVMGKSPSASSFNPSESWIHHIFSTNDFHHTHT